MRKFKILILISFYSSVVFMNAQEKENCKVDTASSKFIIINPFGSDLMLKSVKYGDRIKYKITNINTFKVNASVKSDGVDYDYKDISGFIGKALKSKELVSDLLKKGDLESFAGQQGTDSQKIRNEGILLNRKAQIENRYSDFISLSEKILLRTSLEDNLYNQLSDSIFIKNIDALKWRCNSEYRTCFEDIDSYESAKMEVQNGFNDLDTMYYSFKEAFNDSIVVLKNEIKFVTGTTVKEKEKKKKDLSESIDKFGKKYTFVDSIYNKFKDFKKRTAIFKKSFAGIDLYNRIQEEEFEIYTESEPAMSDEVILRPVLKNSKGEPIKEFPPYYIKTTGRLKVNFSTGYLLSFIGDDNFSVYTNSKDSIVGVSRGNSPNLTHALGAMAHVYCTKTSNFNMALSTGFSLTNNSNLGFYFGGTGLFQEKNRLALTAGISFTQVKRLNTSNLTYDRQHHAVVFSSSSDNKIIYDSVYKPAFFIGVTYNMFEK